jgi:hypothetical protein
VLVHVAASGMEGYVLRGRLESEGIPVFLKGESEGPYRMAYGAVYLWVPEEVEVQARLILGEALSGDLLVPEGADLSPETDWDQAEQP